MTRRNDNAEAVAETNIEEGNKNNPNGNSGDISGMGFSTQEARNLLSVNIVGLVAAFDFSASLMTLQPIYYVVNGDPSLFGLCLGVYDLAFVVMASPGYRFRSLPPFKNYCTALERYRIFSLRTSDNHAEGDREFIFAFKKPQV